MITYIYDALNNVPSAYRVHKEMKTILSNYMYKIDSSSAFTFLVTYNH